MTRKQAILLLLFLVLGVVAGVYVSQYNAVAGGVIIGAALVGFTYWPLRGKPKSKPPQPTPQLFTGDERRGAREVKYDADGEPTGSGGPSPELLARMEAAGMNTTHDRWEDSDAAKREKIRAGESGGDDDGD